MFHTLVSQILDRAEPLLPASLSSEVITVFQYYSYFTSHGVSDLESYLNQLAKQGRTCSLLTLWGAQSGIILVSSIIVFNIWAKICVLDGSWTFLTWVSPLTMKQGFAEHTLFAQQGCTINRKLINDWRPCWSFCLSLMYLPFVGLSLQAMLFYSAFLVALS